MMLPQTPLFRLIAGGGLALIVLWFLVVTFSTTGHSFGSSVTSGIPYWSNTDLLGDIANRTLGFQKIYVIGLKERTDRRDRMLLQAALSGIDIEFVDGVPGENISAKAVPKQSDHKLPSPGVLGCWRAHMNIMDMIIADNITTALILEDDADWDIRIRDQLRLIALSSQALVQPLAGTNDSYADPSYTYPRGPIDKKAVANGITELDFDSLPETVPVTTSPYGDRWSLLWLGHVKIQLPYGDGDVPRGRVLIRDEPTVAPKKHMWTNVKPFYFKDAYPEFTRVVHHPLWARGTAGYAVTQMGAREILRQVGLRDVSHPVDVDLGNFCDGGKEGKGWHTCLATQPPIFNQFRPRGPKGDVSNIDGSWADRGWFDKDESSQNRMSVQLNADRLIAGLEPVDQYEADGVAKPRTWGHKRL